MLLTPALPSAASTPSEVTMLAAWPADSVVLPARAVARVQPAAAGAWVYQWPGTYFEGAFSGTAVYANLGGGAKHVRLSVDGVAVADLLRSQRQVVHVTGLAAGAHRVRVDIVSESQAGPQDFGGFAIPAGMQAQALAPRLRAIEFIGDSYTVGYASASRGRECSDDEVWRTTETSLAFGPQVARHFEADYRLMAISGRGMVRNYANSGGATLPEAYAQGWPSPGALPAPTDAGWSPQVIVIGLGTNDFSTPVAPGEPWPDADHLASAFVERYVGFVQSLRRKHPQAQFILLATDAGHGAAERAIRQAQARLLTAGAPIADVVVLGPLTLDACNWHPSRADHAAIARQLVTAIEKASPRW